MNQNLLYYGDNLDVLRRYIPTESVDLIYLDPPFKSNQDYNVLFAEQDGSRAAAQMKAFGDTWRWDQSSAAAYEELVEGPHQRLALVMRAFRTFLGESDMMAYLAMMAPRLMELHRVLKGTGSLYLHCDPTASHYLKLLLDAVFGPQCFRNEIVWHYYNKFQRGDIPMFARDHDIILFYTRQKGQHHTFRSIHEQRDKPQKQLMRRWDGGTGRIVNAKDADGKVMYREVTTRKIDDVWRLPYIVPASKEGLGFETQKPESLLERIISASTNPGDVVLDPFCGCGTSVSAAQRMGRAWIGIDITHLAINLIRTRLRNAHGADASFQVIGEPVSLPDARTLALQDRYQFQWWALGLVGARPTDQKKGADRGIDGRLFFHDEPGKAKSKQIIFSVKSGSHAGARDIRELSDVVRRENAEIGVLITLDEATRPMRTEAASGGFYKSPWGRQYPRIQILTIEELLNGALIQYPATTGGNVTYKPAPRAKPRKVAEQPELAGLITDPEAIRAQREEAEAARKAIAKSVPSAQKRTAGQRKAPAPAPRTPRRPGR